MNSPESGQQALVRRTCPTVPARPVALSTAVPNRHDAVRFRHHTEWVTFDPRSVLQSPRITGRLFFPVTVDELPLDRRTGETQAIDFQAIGSQASADAAVFVHNLQSQLSKLEDPARRIFEVMAAGRYRAGSVEETAFPDNWPLWRDRLSRAVQTRTPVSILLPSFPFKAPNPLKTRRRLPDMAELLCLARLFEITEAIRLVYPPGAVVHILSEGRIYGPLFEVSAHEAKRYRSELHRMIDLLGAGHALHLVDIEDDVILPWRAEFDAMRQALEPELRTWWEANTDDGHRRYLVRNLVASVHLAKETADLFTSVLNTALTGGALTEAADNLWRIRDSVERRADKAAFTYTLLLGTLRLTQVMDRYDPSAIRATVHPKPGQWGIHLVNKRTSIYPWHGVAVRKVSGSWRIRAEVDAMRQGALPVYSDTNPLPFYYQER